MLSDTNLSSTPDEQRHIVQPNDNFIYFPERGTGEYQQLRMFSRDRLHLSEHGKKVITGNLRHVLYKLRSKALSESL